MKTVFCILSVGLVASAFAGMPGRHLSNDYQVTANGRSVDIVEVRVEATADRVDCHYAAGETAVLTATAKDAKGKTLTKGLLSVSVDNYGGAIVTNFTVDLSRQNPFKVAVSRTTPGFRRLRVKAADRQLKVRSSNYSDGLYFFSVAFDAERIRPGTPDPADFDSFWSNAVATLERTVPLDPRLELVPEWSKGAVNGYRVSFATAGGRRVYGQLAEPKDLSKGPYRVRINVPGAGPGVWNSPWYDDRTVSLIMNVHAYGHLAATNAGAAYAAQDREYAAPNGVARYCQTGIHKRREDYFYYPSILGINRAINWLVETRAACDPKRVSYVGTSQGGGFGLILTGLNRHILRTTVFVPAITDLLGSNDEGRESGWPKIVEAQLPANRAAAAVNAPYFCGANFARRIHTPIRFVAGLSDVVCPAPCVYAAYNVCPSKDKAMCDAIGLGHNYSPDLYSQLDSWAVDDVAEPSPANGGYRFLTFNIWGDYFGNPVAEREGGIVSVLRRWNPDVISLQEVTPSFWKSRVMSDLAKDYVILGDTQGPGAHPIHTPLLVRKSRFKVLRIVGEHYCPELDGSKCAALAVLEDRATQRRLVVFATHFWWRADGPGDDWIRLDNAHRLRARAFALAKEYDAAVIGGGDLNSPVTSSALRDLLANGLADAQETAAVSPRGYPTEHGNPVRDRQGVYYGTPGLRGVNRVPKKSWMLDHVFYEKAKLTAERVQLDTSRTACGVSDHHPVIVDFRFK